MPHARKIRNVKIIALLLSVVLVVTILQLNFGLFNRFNFITAYYDQWTGTRRIIIYGELFETDSLKAALAPGFGFNYERQEDCTVTGSFVNGVKDYNRIMGRAITNSLGADWDETLEKAIRDLPAGRATQMKKLP